MNAQVAGGIIAVAGAHFFDLGERSAGFGGEDRCSGLGDDLDAGADAGLIALCANEADFYPGSIVRRSRNAAVAGRH